MTQDPHAATDYESEDVRYLRKWLNEESTAPIDRQALARVLASIWKVQWLPIESAPKNGATILLWHEKRSEVMAGVWSMHSYGFADEEHPWLVFDPSEYQEIDAYADGVFTHWMAFPEPPGAQADASTLAPGVKGEAA